MNKIKEWEYDDIMYNYIQWQEELENLLNDEELDDERDKKSEKDYSKL